MPVKCKEIISVVEKFAPPTLASEWDNVGLLIGDEDASITSVMVSLDIDEGVIDEAISKGCNLIITHHPVIFEPFKTLNTGHFKQKLIFKIISQNINVYSAHTNLDCAEKGINDYLACNLGLREISVLKKTHESHNGSTEFGFGRVGYLESPVTLKELCQRVKLLLGIDSVRVVGDLQSMASKVAISSGSGADFIGDARNLGCQCFITGDIKYHDACDARDMGLSVIDAGHFETENIYMAYFRDYLKTQFDINNFNVEVCLSKVYKSPFIRV